jgi:3-keto-disaccharide hydrolase
MMARRESPTQEEASIMTDHAQRPERRAARRPRAGAALLATAVFGTALTALSALAQTTTAPTAPARHVATDPGPSPTLGAKPPALGAVVLFDGSSWSAWHRRDGQPSEWQLQEDGAILVHDGDAISNEQFGDFQLHLEFRLPAMLEETGQARANSGVYVHGRYEVQVLDSYGDEPQMGTCGAIYSIAPAIVTASRPPEQWQTYDIVFRAPRFDGAGTLTNHAFITVMHNGVVIHNNLELPHPTPGGLDQEIVARGPLLLQDHGDPIQYRNIWIRPLD